MPDLIQLRKRELEIESGGHDFRKDVLYHEKRHIKRDRSSFSGGQCSFQLYIIPGTHTVEESTPTFGDLSQTL